MARQAKTPKFEIFSSLDNCFNFYKEEDWHGYFEKTRPLVVELGCGKAELLMKLARMHPNRIHVGVDVKTDRMYKPAQIAHQEKMRNIAFVRTHARNMEEVFKPGEIDELWITFPDPYPKKRAAKHRLLHPDFLKLYQQALAPGAKLHFKTDNKALFNWGLEQLKADESFKVMRISRDLHNDANIEEEAKLLTAYERKFIQQGLPIYYARSQKYDLNHI